MEKKELLFERECRRYARERGWVALKMEKNGHKGCPDDLFLHPDGRYMLIEFKKDDRQKPRKEQQVWLDKFPSRAHLVGSFQKFVEVLGE